jgi:small-conductance mechanosensitive channel
MNEKLEAFAGGLPSRLIEIIAAALAAAIGVALALVLHYLIYRVLRRIASASESKTDDLLVERLGRPTRYAMVALGLALSARYNAIVAQIWDRLSGFVVPALVGWIAIALLQALVAAMELRNDILVADPDNLNARRRRTRLAIFSRIASFLIVFVTVAMMLLSVPGVRDIGVTLMASAGLAGLAVAAAAQPALKSFIGGLQMAITEPINIDDLVMIDGESGRVEDIRTTYVIVRTWDERRLVVPTSKFLEQTFQNWTREGAELLGPVFLYLDPLTDIEPLRDEFERQVKAHKLWDGRSVRLQVTDARPNAIEVRLAMSARDASDAFELRCDIRESILAWIRVHEPEAIVRNRIETRGSVLQPED